MLNATGGTPIQHAMTGHFNPHCATCGRTAMQIQQNPTARCQRASLPFDDSTLDVAPCAFVAKKEPRN